MRARTIIKTCLAILLIPLLGTSVAPPGEDLDTLLDDMEIQFRNNLAEYEKSKEIDYLQEAQKTISVMAPSLDRTQKGWEKRAQRLFELRLLLLNKCFNERDYEYDLDNPPTMYTKVSPPLWAAEHQMNLIAGMRPEDIVDPEARRQYEEAIAENNRKIEKHRREKGLHDIVERQILFVSGYMRDTQRHPERQPSMWESIDTVIESEVLRNRLREIFDIEAEKRKQRN